MLVCVSVGAYQRRLVRGGQLIIMNGMMLQYQTHGRGLMCLIPFHFSLSSHYYEPVHPT
jgi:hypothetical protein